MTLKYLPGEAVYSLCTPSGRLKIRVLYIKVYLKGARVTLPPALSFHENSD